MITSRLLYEMVDAMGRAADAIEPKDLKARWLVDRLDELAEEASYAARELADEEDEALRREFRKQEKVTAAGEAAVRPFGGEPKNDARPL